MPQQLPHLPDHLWMQIFCHLSIEERIRFERCSSHWQDTMLASWKAHRSLNLSRLLYHPGFKRSDPETYCARDKTLLQIVSRSLTSLRSLRLANVAQFGSIQSFAAKFELTPTALRLIAQYQCLKRLDISHHYFANEESFAQICHFPATLEELKMENCRLDQICDPHARTVKELSRYWVGGWSPSMDVVDNILVEFSLSHPNLKRLSLRGSCYGFMVVTDRCLNFLPECLEELDLSGCFVAKISSLEFVLRLPCLKCLLLERISISDGDLDILATSQCRHTLQKLALCYSPNVYSLATISSLANLRELRLDGNRENMTDDALSLICNGCPQIRVLSLENCSSLTDAGLSAIGQLSQLTYLSLTAVKLVTDRTLDAITQRGCESRLEQLHLRYCPRLTRSGIALLASLCSLQVISLSGNPNLDASTFDLLRRRTSLREADLHDCAKMENKTDYAARQFPPRLPPPPLPSPTRAVSPAVTAR